MEIRGHQFVVGIGFETHSHSLLFSFGNLSTCSGVAAVALTDAGLAAAASVQGGVQCFGQGAHITAPPGKAVAGALFGGGQGGAQAGGGLGQTDSQPVQPVRVQPRQGTDGVGGGQLRKGVKQLAAQSKCVNLSAVYSS